MRQSENILIINTKNSYHHQKLQKDLTTTAIKESNLYYVFLVAELRVRKFKKKIKIGGA